MTEISSKIACTGPFNIQTPLSQVIARRYTVDETLPESKVIQLGDGFMRQHQRQFSWSQWIDGW